MSDKSKIEWCDATWNPVTGCTKVSAGCANCYAERNSKRLAGRAGYPADEPFRVMLHPDRLDQPLRWKRPRKILIPSMGDLFHEDVPDDFIEEVFKVMAQARKHTFLVLSKRIGRAAYWMLQDWSEFGIELAYNVPHNIWIGTSVEDQATADERIPQLLGVQAWVRFVSYEPALGPVDFSAYMPDECPIHASHHSRGRNCLTKEARTGIDWLIAGGESGKNARPSHPWWFQQARDQCVAAGVPFFFKQWGEWGEVASFDPITKGDIIKYAEGTSGGAWMRRVGKKTAGRLLDGKEWSEWPQP